MYSAPSSGAAAMPHGTSNWTPSSRKTCVWSWLARSGTALCTVRRERTTTLRLTLRGAPRRVTGAGGRHRACAGRPGSTRHAGSARPAAPVTDGAVQWTLRRSACCQAALEARAPYGLAPKPAGGPPQDSAAAGAECAGALWGAWGEARAPRDVDVAISERDALRLRQQVAEGHDAHGAQRLAVQHQHARDLGARRMR